MRKVSFTERGGVRWRRRGKKEGKDGRGGGKGGVRK